MVRWKKEDGTIPPFFLEYILKLQWPMLNPWQPIHLTYFAEYIMLHTHTLKTLSNTFNWCIMLGGQYINLLDDMFKKDILRKPLGGFGLEMDRSAYSLASESSKLLASKMNRSVVSLASFNGDDSVIQSLLFHYFNCLMMDN